MRRRALAFFALVLAACDDGGTPSHDAGFDGPPEILEFSASTDIVSPLQTASLTWRTKNARIITVGSAESTYVSSFDASGSVLSEPIRVTTTFILRAEGVDSTVTSSVTVSVHWPNPIVDSFSVTPSAEIVGSFVSLGWSARNAEYVRIFKNDALIIERQNPTIDVAQGMGNGQIGDSREVWRIEASNPAGTDSREITITASFPSIIDHYSISPRSYYGRTVTATLTWSTRGAVRTTLEEYNTPFADFPNSIEGSFNFTLSGPTQLRLTMYNEVGQESYQLISIDQPFYEGEPNDFARNAQDINLRGAVIADLSTPADVDVYLYTPGSNGRLRATVLDVSATGCSFDNSLVIVTRRDVLLARTTESALGTCAVADVDAPGEDVFIEVHSENGEVGSYLLLVEED